MLPFENSELGSIANTATFLPCSINFNPNASIKVLFPTPGTPEIPILYEFPENFKHFSIISFANFLCSGKVLSTNVMALLKLVIFHIVISLTISKTFESFDICSVFFKKKKLNI